MIVHASPTDSWVLLVAASDRPMPAPRPTSGATMTARSPSISNMMSVAIPNQIPYSDDHSTRRPRPSLPPVTVYFFSSTMSSHMRATVAAQGVFGSPPARAHVVETVAAAGTQHAFQREVGGRGRGVRRRGRRCRNRRRGGRVDGHRRWRHGGWGRRAGRGHRERIGREGTRGRERRQGRRCHDAEQCPARVHGAMIQGMQGGTRVAAALLECAPLSAYQARFSRH